MAVEKLSVSVPATVAKEARKYSGKNGLSAMVTEGLRHQIAMSKLHELNEEMDRRFGPVPQDILDEVERWLDE